MEVGTLVGFEGLQMCTGGGCSAHSLTLSLTVQVTASGRQMGSREIRGRVEEGLGQSCPQGRRTEVLGTSPGVLFIVELPAMSCTCSVYGCGPD